MNVSGCRLVAGAAKEFEALDKAVKERVSAVLLRLAAGTTKTLALTGRPEFKQRAGDWRILWGHEGGEVVIYAIRHRSEVYE